MIEYFVRLDQSLAHVLVIAVTLRHDQVLELVVDQLLSFVSQEHSELLVTVLDFQILDISTPLETDHANRL